MNELEKHSKTFEQRVVVEEFLDWLNEEKVLLGEYVKPGGHCAERLAPILGNRQELLDRYFGIDPAKLDQERRKLLETVPAHLRPPVRKSAKANWKKDYR